MRSRPALVFIVLSFAAWGSAQSLGDVARKEKERRERNRTKGVEVREFDEDEIFEDDEDAAENGASEPENAGTAGSGPEERRLELSLESDTDEERLEREGRDRRRSEAEWRARVQEARARVARARERKETLSGLHLAQGESYVDAQGRTVVASLEHLRRLVREAEEELAAAEEALVDLREEARRAGVPPGWLR